MTSYIQITTVTATGGPVKVQMTAEQMLETLDLVTLHEIAHRFGYPTQTAYKWRAGLRGTMPEPDLYLGDRIPVWSFAALRKTWAPPRGCRHPDTVNGSTCSTCGEKAAASDG